MMRWWQKTRQVASSSTRMRAEELKSSMSVGAVEAAESVEVGAVGFWVLSGVTDRDEIEAEVEVIPEEVVGREPRESCL
jgi:hypothetical protein